MRQAARTLGWLALVTGVAGSMPARPLAAQQTASQVVIFRILPASHAAIAPVAKPMSLQAGHTESGASWSISTNQADRKILASLDRALPRGSTLLVMLTPPPGATSAGPVVLDTVGTDVVTGIPVTSQTDMPLRYIVNADPRGVPTNPVGQTVMVTYTVVEQP
jgi:hypothetical protein